jgi:hypothetical protein
MSMRGATRADIVKAMGVEGIEIKQVNALTRLHYVSNYSRGERWGSGDVNYSFDDGGRVTIIHALLTGPSASGNYEFIWNATSLPAGCSDLPDSSMNHCN